MKTRKITNPSKRQPICDPLIRLPGHQSTNVWQWTNTRKGFIGFDARKKQKAIG